MGSCCSLSEKIHPVTIILKFPHGKKGIRYNHDRECFDPCDDVTDLFQKVLQRHEWDQWILYNDESPNGKTYSTGGHSKGMVAWNRDVISWTCHSLPKFPKTMFGTSPIEIEPSEQIYGQSFFNTEIPFDAQTCARIVEQLSIMKVHVYEIHYDRKNPVTINTTSVSTTSTVSLSSTCVHLAKPPTHHIDIYSECLSTRYGITMVETWRRGHPIINKQSHLFIPVKDIVQCQYNDTIYLETQDHSKWGTSMEENCWFGDLNRMVTQEKRGGGGFIYTNKKVAFALRSLATTSKTENENDKNRK